MRSGAVLAAGGAVALLTGCGGSDATHDRYVAAMRPLLADVVSPHVFDVSPVSTVDSPFLRAADAIADVAAPARVRREHRRLVGLLRNAEWTFAQANALTATSLEEDSINSAQRRSERAARAVYAEIRVICAKGYAIATTCADDA